MALVEFPLAGEQGKRDSEPLRIDDWDESLVESKPLGTRLNSETGGTPNGASRGFVGS